jgi:hypothetical protein
MDKDVKNCACENAGKKVPDHENDNNKQAQQEGMDVMHHPPTDRQTLADPEALDDLVDLRHLELDEESRSSR